MNWRSIVKQQGSLVAGMILEVARLRDALQATGQLVADQQRRVLWLEYLTGHLERQLREAERRTNVSLPQ